MVKMNLLLYFMSVLCLPLVHCRVVNNVRLIEPIPYMMNIITETVHRIEDAEWCNLKVPDHTMDLEETVFGRDVEGKVSFKNGFIVSVEEANILRESLGQMWRFNNTANTTRVEITGTLRLIDVTYGLDVEVAMANGVQHYTVEFVQPLISYDIRVIRDMFTEAIDVTVTPIVTPIKTKMYFMPSNELTDVMAGLYDFNIVRDSAQNWASDFIRPFVLNAVENVFEYPEICYDCPVQ